MELRSGKATERATVEASARTLGATMATAWVAASGRASAGGSAQAKEPRLALGLAAATATVSGEPKERTSGAKSERTWAAAMASVLVPALALEKAEAWGPMTVVAKARVRVEGLELVWVPVSARESVRASGGGLGQARARESAKTSVQVRATAWAPEWAWLMVLALDEASVLTSVEALEGELGSTMEEAKAAAWGRV
jgi:hypothetical protein